MKSWQTFALHSLGFYDLTGTLVTIDLVLVGCQLLCVCIKDVKIRMTVLIPTYLISSIYSNCCKHQSNVHCTSLKPCLSSVQEAKGQSVLLGQYLRRLYEIH